MREFPTLDMFHKWIAKRNPDLLMAQSWGPLDCPLCLFLQDEGFDHPFVGATHWGFGGQRFTDRKIPGWARELVYWIDKTKPREITAAECLHIMEQPFFNPDRQA
jgi:hypothetical protein